MLILACIDTFQKKFKSYNFSRNFEISNCNTPDVSQQASIGACNEHLFRTGLDGITVLDWSLVPRDSKNARPYMMNGSLQAANWPSASHVHTSTERPTGDGAASRHARIDPLIISLSILYCGRLDNFIHTSHQQ